MKRMMYKSKRKTAGYYSTLFVLSFILVAMSVMIVVGLVYISGLQDRYVSTSEAYRATRTELRKTKASEQKALAALAKLSKKLRELEMVLKNAENVASDHVSQERRTPVPRPEPAPRPLIIYNTPPVRHGSATYFRGECLSCYQAGY